LWLFLLPVYLWAAWQALPTARFARKIECSAQLTLLRQGDIPTGKAPKLLTGIPVSHEYLTAHGHMNYAQAKAYFEHHEFLHVATSVNGKLIYVPTSQNKMFAHPSLHGLIRFQHSHAQVSLYVEKAQQLFIRLGKGQLCNGRVGEWPHGIAQPFEDHIAINVLRSASPATTTRFTSTFAKGLAMPVFFTLLPFIHALGITTENQFAAFLMVYGYWLGDGWLSKGSVAFAPIKPHDVFFLRDLFKILGLQPKEYFTEADIGTKKPKCFRIYESSWVTFFTDEYGHKYHFSILPSVKKDMSSGERCAFKTAKKALSDQVDAIAGLKYRRAYSNDIDVFAEPEFDASDTKTQPKKTVEATASAKWLMPFVWGLQREHARYLLRGLRYADGNQGDSNSTKNGGTIYTSSARFRDEIVQLAIHAGFSTLLAVNQHEGVTVLHKGGPVTARTTSWRVRYSDGWVSEPRVNSPGIEDVAFEGDVWGFNIDGLLMVRRPLCLEAGRSAIVSRAVLIGKAISSPPTPVEKK
jgi:hypothetical protein